MDFLVIIRGDLMALIKVLIFGGPIHFTIHIIPLEFGEEISIAAISTEAITVESTVVRPLQVRITALVQVVPRIIAR